MTTSSVFRVVALPILLNCSCLLVQPRPSARVDLVSAVNAASAGVAAVGQVEKGASGAPTIMLEELHNSRAAQIQAAIMFVRLYSKAGLRDIALEGYLKERPRIDGRWFTDRWKGQSPLSNARVAVRLLKEGEISGAEFAKLTFPDLRLHPVERLADHNVQLPDAAFQGLNSLAEKLGRLAEVNRMLEQAGKGVPFAVSEQLARAEDMESQRTARRIPLDPTQLRNWNQWLSFWRGRAQANETMFGETLSALSASGASLIVMNIGRAHTADTVALFSKKGMPFAVVTPLAVKNNDQRGDLGSGYQRKDERKSVQSTGTLMSALNAMFPTVKKPEPVIDPVPWFEAKAQLYQNIDQIVNSILGPPSPPGGGKPPYGFGDDDFNGRFVSIAPASIALLQDDDRRKSVLFPVVLRSQRGLSTTYWVKAAITDSSLFQTVLDQAAVIEGMLRKALAEVQGERDAPTQAEDQQGHVKTSGNTIAVIGTDKQAVARAILGTS